MVTRNFLNLLAMVLESGNLMGCLKVLTVNGAARFLSGTFGFPYSPTASFTLNATAAGISIGTGTTPESEDDYNLEATITSGVNVVLTATTYGAENPWYPFVKYDLTVTNTGANPLVVTEVGYKQTASVTKVIGSTSRSNEVLLLDRCVLDTPVTIAPGDVGIVTYRLQTNPVPVPPTVAGIQMASFSYGTDAQIAAILDAAAAGTVDLQRDAGWKVGDQRVINVAAFTAGGDVAVAAQQIPIVITSFDEYMDCGNVLQFDFACGLAEQARLFSVSSSAGGYGESEMKTVTLPALAEALPDWLKTRLKTFSVLAGSYNGPDSTQELETITGNKLALRSEMEVLGTHTYSIEGEGSAMPYYSVGSYPRIKSNGISSGNTVNWWLRSIASNGYCTVIMNGGGLNTIVSANNANSISPFGCL